MFKSLQSSSLSEQIQNWDININEDYIQTDEHPITKLKELLIKTNAPDDWIKLEKRMVIDGKSVIIKEGDFVFGKINKINVCLIKRCDVITFTTKTLNNDNMCVLNHISTHNIDGDLVSCKVVEYADYINNDDMLKEVYLLRKAVDRAHMKLCDRNINYICDLINECVDDVIDDYWDVII